MALNLESLQLIDLIERHGSFAAAARAVGRVPSALTYVIRQLEEDLDVLLFDRTGHRAVLTAAGQELLREGRHLLQAARELEHRVRRVASGWEVELRIAIDGILRFEGIIELVKRFYAESPVTRLRLSTEVLSGTWDALLSGRADLAIGTPSRAPIGAESAGSFNTRLMGQVEMVFAVAPFHPLAQMNEPLGAEEIKRHRIVAVSDTSRNLPVATVGILRGQDVLTVASMRDKIAAQIAGIACGYLPLGLIRADLAAGRLVARTTTEPRFEGRLYYAWSSSTRGKAIRWFLDRLDNTETKVSILP